MGANFANLSVGQYVSILGNILTIFCLLASASKEIFFHGGGGGGGEGVTWVMELSLAPETTGEYFRFPSPVASNTSTFHIAVCSQVAFTSNRYIFFCYICIVHNFTQRPALYLHIALYTVR
jgi:hypothetical protein